MESEDTIAQLRAEIALLEKDSLAYADFPTVLYEV